MAKAKSKAPSKSRRAPGAKNVRARGIDHKQQTALNTRSLGVRNSSESTIGPDSDVPDEITSAAPPNVENLNEPGRASSPMFDEVTVTGKGRTSHPGAPMSAPRGQNVKAGEGTDEGKVADIHKIEDLPAGSTVEIRAEEVVIHVAIAGGARKTFHGKTVAAALASFNAFAENGPELLPTGRTPEEASEFERINKQSENAAIQRAADAEAEKKKAEG